MKFYMSIPVAKKKPVALVRHGEHNFFCCPNSEQAADNSVGRDVDLFGGGNFRQARHCHDVAAQHDDKARARRNFQFAHGDAEIRRATEFRGVVAQRVLRFGNANRQVPETAPFNVGKLFLRGGGEVNSVRAVNLRVADGEILILCVEILEFHLEIILLCELGIFLLV